MQGIYILFRYIQFTTINKADLLWDANSPSASNPNVQYSVHRSSSLFPILRQTNPVRVCQPQSSEIYLLIHS